MRVQGGGREEDYAEASAGDNYTKSVYLLTFGEHDACCRGNSECRCDQPVMKRPIHVRQRQCQDVSTSSALPTQPSQSIVYRTTDAGRCVNSPSETSTPGQPNYAGDPVGPH